MPTTLAAVVTAAALSSAACYTMRPVTFDDLRGEQPSRVWATRRDQSVVVVDGPQVFRGKLVGFVRGRYRELLPADLTRLMVRRFARGQTVALISAGALGFTAVAVVLSGRGEDPDPCVGGSVDCEPPIPPTFSP
jgi:hypothetical protein